MMNSTRYNAEITILNAKLPRRYALGTNEMRVYLPLEDFGGAYELHIYDLSHFPEKQPIVTPGRMLCNYKGQPLDYPSGPDHCLGEYKGETILCLFSQWDPNYALYTVVLKAHLWLVSYLLSLKNGQPIETFLPHGR